MAQDVDAQVECHSGSRYGERPLAFVFEGQHHNIAAIVRQWRMPDGLCFRVVTQSEQHFDLTYIEDQDHWRIFPVA
jgi:hypothetical protein